jgi:hypothetical protein
MGVVGHLLDRLASFFLNIADGNKLHVGLRQEATEVAGAPIADTDSAHHNPFAGRSRTIPT